MSRSHWPMVAALGLVLFLGAAIPRAALAQPSESNVSAQRAMERYFDGEKNGGLILGGMGAAGIAGGAVLVTRDSDGLRGAGYVALGFGAVHAAAGVFVYVASARRITKFTGDISSDEGAFVVAESKRVRGVKTQFTVLKIVEGVLIAGGAGVAIAGFATDRDTLGGVGAGVAVEALATLAFDIVASRRAGRYLRALRGVRATATGDGAGVSLGFRF